MRLFSFCGSAEERSLVMHCLALLLVLAQRSFLFTVTEAEHVPSGYITYTYLHLISTKVWMIHVWSFCHVVSVANMSFGEVDSRELNCCRLSWECGCVCVFQLNKLNWMGKTYFHEWSPFMHGWWLLEWTPPLSCGAGLQPADGWGNNRCSVTRLSRSSAPKEEDVSLILIPLFFFFYNSVVIEVHPARLLSWMMSSLFGNVPSTGEEKNLTDSRRETEWKKETKQRQVFGVCKHDSEQRGEPSAEQSGAADQTRHTEPLHEGQEKSAKHLKGGCEGLPHQKCLCHSYCRSGHYR